MKLTVIIPVYNEEKTIRDTLLRLVSCRDQSFDVVVCDNSSTDRTREIINDVLFVHQLDWAVVTEERKGTGAAADTAAREAIRRGATHLARTDADCLPASDWVPSIRAAFAEKPVQFIAGISHPRTDDTNIGPARAAVLRLVNEVAMAFGRVRPSNFGRQFKGPYLMVSGNNLAITAELYETVGGFTRTAIEEAHEDRNLIQAVRLVTNQYEFRRDVIVHASARRIQAWGIVRSLRWYAGHYFNPKEVDLR
jgi:cellulose synthase/poly-beta-1,6-N-acetylglucosamine synthase-like glycosyltransferase